MEYNRASIMNAYTRVCVCVCVNVCGELVSYMRYDDAPVGSWAAMEAYCWLQWAQASKVVSQGSGRGPRQQQWGGSKGKTGWGQEPENRQTQ